MGSLALLGSLSVNGDGVPHPPRIRDPVAIPAKRTGFVVRQTQKSPGRRRSPPRCLSTRVFSRPGAFTS
ncbi:hypothetical protein SJ05684_c30820 [Sinorhizobium sojae CCBAU 05684]|uniref:Uncharacterized protein n=1 Tax=Sinorhizobium sojae CCBAU 05684 TaxID=716928 RepID=A0A249PFB8_9HYPH|nr:hypothetical protein SJ05684_c30820 [Sinorhizobium sojae CCBAU 05684]